jgi:RHS repeat-associated protein
VYAYTAGSEAAPGGGTQPKGMLKSVTDRTNITKTFAYAQTGDQVQIVDPARGTTNIGYDEIGRPTSTGRAASGALPFAATTMAYDVRSRVTRVTSPSVTNVVSGVAHQLQVETAYDSNGNPITVTTKDLTGGDPQRQVTTTFDNNDRPTQMSAPNSKNLSYTYDEVSNVLVATDPRGLQVSSAYDDRNLVTSRVALNYVDTTGGATRQVTLGTNTYDVLGRIVSQADALGRVTETTYTGDGYVRQVTRKNYRQLNNAVRDVVLQYREYDAVGNVMLERSGAAAGTGVRTVTRSFNSRNFVTSQTLDPTGLNRTTTFATDDEGRQLSATTGSFVSSVGYDAAGRPASSTVGGVGSDSVTYDGWGRAVTATNKRGYTTDYVLDIADRIITTRSPDVTVWAANGASSTLRPESSTGFDTFGGVTHSRDERGLVTVAANDTSGRTTSVTYPADAGITPTESFSYDVNDNVISSTDRRSQISTFTYDLFNRRRTVVGPAGAGSPTSTSVFDEASQLTQSVAPDGSVVNYSYDDLGRNRTTGQVVRQDANAVYTTTNDYDDLGNVVLSINPAGKSKSAAYNPAGQVVTATDEIGVATQYGYTPNTGWLASVVQANGRRAATTFDAAGRKTAVSVTDPSGATVFAVDQWTYDANSNPVSHTRPNGAADTYVYDKLDRMVQSNSLLISPAVYGTVDVGYDIAGNQARITDPRNNTTTSTYNNWNLLSSTVEPSTATFPALTDRTWSVGYDAGGLPTSESRPGGVSVSRVFDALGRMTQETGSGGASVAATRQFTFDVMGRIATANAPANQQTFTYDDRGLLRTSNGQSSAGYSSFIYDSVGRMTGRTDGAGSVSYGYTDRGEMNTYTVSPSGGQASTVSLAWNPFGQVSQINYPAGVTRTLAYDGAGRLNDDQTSKVGQGVIARRQNNYNPDGTPSSLVVTQPGNTAAGTYLYTYDAGSRLTNYAGPGWGSAYTYDNAGNRLTGDGKSFTYDERNRLTSGSGTSYTWSARGNRTGVVGQAAFTFDGLDRQTGVGGATYTYDSLDRVIGRSVSGVTKFFNYAGFETDPTSDGTSSWSRSPSGSVLGQTRAGTSVLVGTERHGDVAWTLNPTTGTIADSTVSDPYGKVLSVTGTPGQVGFQGDWTDPLTGLVWMAARWYDTQTGTFISRDTYPGSVGAALTLNRYLYVLGSPLKYNDPTGREGDELDPNLAREMGFTEAQIVGGIDAIDGYYVNVQATAVVSGASLDSDASARFAKWYDQVGINTVVETTVARAVDQRLEDVFTVSIGAPASTSQSVPSVGTFRAVVGAVDFRVPNVAALGVAALLSSIQTLKEHAADGVRRIQQGNFTSSDAKVPWVAFMSKAKVGEAYLWLSHKSGLKPSKASDDEVCASLVDQGGCVFDFLEGASSGTQFVTNKGLIGLAKGFRGFMNPAGIDFEPAVKKLGKAFVAADGLFAALDQLEADRKQPGLADWKEVARALSSGALVAGGAAFGATKAGVSAAAACSPGGLAAVVCGGVGALAGAYVGSKVGQAAADALNRTAFSNTWAPNWAKPEFPQTAATAFSKQNPPGYVPCPSYGANAGFSTAMTPGGKC